MAYSSLQELRDAVVEQGGVLTVVMGEVRDAHGNDRLGPIVRAEIASRLKALGLGYTPSTLPSYQDERIRLFVADSRVGELIRACHRRGPKSDELLREAANDEAARKLKEIRELVC